MLYLLYISYISLIYLLYISYISLIYLLYNSYKPYINHTSLIITDSCISLFVLLRLTLRVNNF